MQNNNSESKTKKSSFLEIINSWPDYFEDWHEGLGTTYERFILHRYFETLVNQVGVGSILEAPAFGMTGISDINSLWWAAQGIKPIVLDDDKDRLDKSRQVWAAIPLQADLQFQPDWEKLPLGDHSVDCSWNFASMWFVPKPEQFAAELKRVSKKAIFICVPNIHGIGYKLRKQFNRTPKELQPEQIKPANIKRWFTGNGWQLWRSGYLDIPPWPDIAMKKEDLFPKIGLGFLLSETNENGEVPQTERTCIIDYFSGQRPNLEQDILKYAFLENVPFPVKQLWAHHRWFIFRPW